MTNLSEIMVRGLRFAHWIMGTLGYRFSTAVTCTLNKSASIRSGVNSRGRLPLPQNSGNFGWKSSRNGMCFYAPSEVVRPEWPSRRNVAFFVFIFSCSQKAIVALSDWLEIMRTRIGVGRVCATGILGTCTFRNFKTEFFFWWDSKRPLYCVLSDFHFHSYLNSHHFYSHSLPFLLITIISSGLRKFRSHWIGVGQKTCNAFACNAYAKACVSSKTRLNASELCAADFMWQIYLHLKIEQQLLKERTWSFNLCIRSDFGQVEHIPNHANKPLQPPKSFRFSWFRHSVENSYKNTFSRKFLVVRLVAFSSLEILCLRMTRGCGP